MDPSDPICKNINQGMDARLQEISQCAYTQPTILLTDERKQVLAN